MRLNKGEGTQWTLEHIGYLSQKHSLGTFLDKFVHNLSDVLTKKERITEN